MKRFLPVLIFLIISCASISKKEKLEPIDPQSIIPPSVTASYNHNIDYSTIKSIAIVNIASRSIPTMEDLNSEYKKDVAQGRLDLELKLQSSRKKLELLLLDDLLDEKEKNLHRQHLNNMDAIWKRFTDSLDTAVKDDDIRQKENFKKIYESLVYNSYENIFLTLGFDVIERKEIDLVLSEMALSMSGLVDENSALDAGKLVSADAICIVEILNVYGPNLNPPDPMASYRQESFKVIKTETGQIVFSGSNSNTVGGRLKMFEKLVTKILSSSK